MILAFDSGKASLLLRTTLLSLCASFFAVAVTASGKKSIEMAAEAVVRP